METQDSQEKPDEVQEPVEQPEAKEEEVEEKEEESKEGEKKKGYVFKECPKTSGFSKEEVHTENSKTLDNVEVAQVKRPVYSYAKRVRISTFFNDDGEQFKNLEVKVSGWGKTLRSGGKGAFNFIELNDGSTIKNLQVVVDQTISGFEELKNEGVGTSYTFIGTLIESPKEGQKYELQVNDNSKHSMKICGSCSQGEYPLAKKKHSKEYLREIMHLRPRTNLIGVVARLRNSLSIATHEFFQKRGFMYVHTPMITASDCEGAGEMFQVTTVLPEKDLPVTEVKTTKDGKVDYSEDFFKKPAFLTVSGQLNVENYCCGLGDVYTFSPTFRAENSHTKKHLAEFWMIEPELAFADLRDDMDCAEEYIKYCVNYVLTNHKDDLEWLEKNESKKLIANLEHIVKEDFERVTYTEAIQELQKKSKKAKFEILPEWGIDLQTEHERYLTEKIYKKPVIVYNYPKDIKAFYMRMNEDTYY